MNIKWARFSLRDIANMLDTRIETVQKWRRKGWIKAHMSGPNERFTVRGMDFIDFLQKNPKYAEIYLTKETSGWPYIIQEEIRKELYKCQRVFTVEQLANAFDIQPNTVRKWVRNGLLHNSAKEFDVHGILLSDLLDCFSRNPLLEERYTEQLERLIKYGFVNL